MVVKEEFDKENLELGCEIFHAYKKAEGDARMYAKMLKELSLKYGKSEKFLRQIRHEYMKYCAKDIDEMDVMKGNLNMNRICINFFDDLFKVPFVDRNEYLFSRGITYRDLSKKCDSYRKSNGVYSYMLDDLLEDYCDFFNEVSKGNKKNKAVIDYISACVFFDNLVNSGFYSISDYVEHIFSTGHDIGELTNKVCIIRNKIKSYNADAWKYYCTKMENNRKKQFLLNKDSIEEFNRKLNDSFNGNSSFNVIDYYLIVGLPFKKYKEITNGFVSPQDVINLNKFLGPLDIYDNNSYISERYVLSSSYRIGDRLISDDEKEKLIKFFKDYNIPFKYFMFGVTKYLCGDLDNYLDSFEKKL